MMGGSTELGTGEEGLTGSAVVMLGPNMEFTVALLSKGEDGLSRGSRGANYPRHFWDPRLLVLCSILKSSPKNSAGAAE